MKKYLLSVVSMFLFAAAIGQQQVDSITVKKVLKLNGKRVLGINNDSTAASKDSTKLITEAAAKKYADAHTYSQSQITGLTDSLKNKVSRDGSYANPSWLTSLAWSKTTGTPTTKSGYGITDVMAYSDTSGKWIGIGWLPSFANINTSYSNPSWITSLAASKLTGLSSSQVTTALGYTPENAANKAAANGYAPLGSDTKIPSSYLPAIATNNVWTVSSQTAMLALSSAVIGDVAIRSDSSLTYILKATDYTKAFNWVQLLFPVPPVSSVNGFTGNVTLLTSNISEGGTSYYWTAARSRAAQSNTATGLSYDNTTGVQSLTSGYVIPTTTEESNWNTAYGWGNHASAGYVTASSTNTFTNKSGNISQWTNNSGYLTANQTITLSGDVSGSGTTAITTTIGSSKVTNAMLAGSIAASKLVGTDITTVGTLSAGAVPYSLLTGTIPTWNQNTTGSAGSLANTLTIGAHLTGSSFNGSSAITIATDATAANTVSTIMARDANGDVAARFFVGSLSGSATGNAGTATAFQTARTIQGVSFDGTANINIINGTGFVKASGTTISYDNSTYLTTSSAASTYAPLTGVGTSGTWGISISGNAATVTNGVYTTTLNGLGDARYLQLTGGTLTGNLTAGSNDISAGRIFSSQTNALIQAYDAGGTSATLRAYSGSNYWDWKVDNTSTLKIAYNGTNKISIDNTGAIAGTAAAFSSYISANGNTTHYAATFSGGSTTGSSYGINIDAGTNGSDYAMLVRNSSGSTQFFTIAGDGRVSVKSNYFTVRDEGGGGSYTGAAFMQSNKDNTYLGTLDASQPVAFYQGGGIQTVIAGSAFSLNNGNSQRIYRSGSNYPDGSWYWDIHMDGSNNLIYGVNSTTAQITFGSGGIITATTFSGNTAAIASTTSGFWTGTTHMLSIKAGGTTYYFTANTSFTPN